MAELEESRRKLGKLRMLKNLASCDYNPAIGAINRTLSLFKLPNRSMVCRNLKTPLRKPRYWQLILLLCFRMHMEKLSGRDRIMSSIVGIKGRTSWSHST